VLKANKPVAFPEQAPFPKKKNPEQAKELPNSKVV